MGGMTEPELSDEETRTLIDYARRKFAEERWPLSPALRPFGRSWKSLTRNRKPPGRTAQILGHRRARPSP
jgi:hypothetical protein